MKTHHAFTPWLARFRPHSSSASKTRRHERRHGAKLHAVACLLPCAMLGATTAGADDWVTAVGHDAARTGLSTEIGPDSPDVLWTGSRPSIVSQQGLAAGDLFITNRIQSFTIPTGTWIVAHDIDSGAEAWAIQLPFDAGAPSHRSKVSGYRDGQVYATRAGNTTEDFIYALDPADGSILWESEAKVGEETTESIAFTDDGDIIVGNFGSVMRISKVDGTTVWSSPRSCPTSNGCSPAVFGGRVYIWEASGTGPKITAFDATDGTRLYSSAGIGGGLIQQLGLLVGPDGTVYAPRSQNNPVSDFFVALTDTGTEFVEKWRVPLGYVPFASFGIGPDGTVYSYAPDLRILRLDPADGATLDMSDPLPGDFPYSPRMAIDAAGKVYVTNGGFPNGALFSFNADLTPRWDEPITNVNVGGPVLARDGTLFVCGVGTDVRAYRSESTSITIAGTTPRPGFAASYPNPFRASVELRYDVAQGGPVTLGIFDVHGRLVRVLVDGANRAPGTYATPWEGRDAQGRDVPPGVYFYELRHAAGTTTGKMLRVD